ncbi:hypothetical protein T4C_3009 [Trichinella pseudospiralis]|uniref:Uncharacterized protein n=1 Tax=Trichinella pseudospiralis TaxID=6337 RepID=A0A0V1GNR7_TRIPS|nr:hypothetical protein T4C_3009 [Trichinella pseudospiralis]
MEWGPNYHLYYTLTNSRIPKECDTYYPAVKVYHKCKEIKCIAHSCQINLLVLGIFLILESLPPVSTAYLILLFSKC